MKKSRRFLALLLCFVMCFLLLPTWALAEGEKPAEQTEEQVADMPDDGEPEGEVPEEPGGEAAEEVYEEPSHEHAWEAVVTEPTCTEQGYTTYTCACGESYTDNYVEPLNHPETEEIPELPATCTEVGISAGLRCLVCGEIIEGCEEIPALGHTVEDVAEVPATTESTGVTAGTKCAVCGAILSGCEEIPMLEVIVELEPKEEPEPAQETETEEEPEPTEELEPVQEPEAEPGQEEKPVQETPAEPGPEQSQIEEPAVSKVQVIFTVTPDNAALTVYSKDEQGEKIEYEPEPDGSYLLLPGMYYYTLTAEDYEAVEETELRIAASEEPARIEIVMEEELIAEEIGGKKATEAAVEAIINSGTWRNSLTWAMDDDGTLTFRGDGAILPAWGDYASSLEAPWFNENVKTVIIENGITGIGNGAFYGCPNLVSVSLPDTLKWIGQEDDGANDIGLSYGQTPAFPCPQLTSISIPESIEYIRDGSFPDSLTTVVSPVGYRDIFNWDHISSFSFPEDATNIRNNAFAMSEMKEFTIMDGIVSIGDYAFSDCGYLTSITIPNSVMFIGDSVFAGCWSLMSVTIPPSVTKIGRGLLESSDSSQVKTIKFLGDFPDLDERCFGGLIAKAYYPLQNSTWTAEVLKNYGGDITWIPYCLPGEELPSPVLKAIGNSNNGVKLTWEVIPGVSMYSVFRKEQQNSEWTKVGDTEASSYIDTSAVSGTKYYYSVIAVFGTEISPYSISKEITFIAAPTISMLANTDGGVQIKWSKVSGAKTYRVLRKGPNDTEYMKVADTTELTLRDEQVVSGAKYSYAIRCLNSDGQSFASAAQPARAITYIAAPTVSSVTKTIGGILIKWGKVKGAAKYRVLRKSSSEDSWTKVGDTTGLSMTDKKATSGKKYNYAVRCLSSDGKIYTSAAQPSKSITYIAAPSGISVTGIRTGITIKWKKVAGAAKYRVLRKVEGGSWKILVDTTAVSYQDKTVAAGTQYSYTVRCLSSDGKTYTSAYDTTGKTMIYCDAPVISTVTNAKTGVTVKWSSVTGAEAYRVFRKTGSENWTAIGVTTKVNFTDKTAESGVRYSYAVRCVTGDGKYYASALSASKAITYVSAPVLSSATATLGKVTVKWAKVAGAEKYRVLRKTGSGSWTKLTDTSSVSYADQTAVKGTQYSYTVRCISADGRTYTSAYDTTGKTVTAK